MHDVLYCLCVPYFLKFKLFWLISARSPTLEVLIVCLLPESSVSLSIDCSSCVIGIFSFIFISAYALLYDSVSLLNYAFRFWIVYVTSISLCLCFLGFHSVINSPYVYLVISLNSLSSSMEFMIVLLNSVSWRSSRKFSLVYISVGVMDLRDGYTALIFHVCIF